MNYLGMNYIGKALTTVRDFYNDLNPATLSGAIDVVIIEQEDGSFVCSPFHVRFGKRGVFSRREKIVDITINEEPVDLHMKLGETGEAFFVERQEKNDDSEEPHALATSPLPTSYMPQNFSGIDPPTISNNSQPSSKIIINPVLDHQTSFDSAGSPPVHHTLETIPEKPRIVRELSESPKRERHESGNDSDNNNSAKKIKQKSRRRRRAKTAQKSKEEEIFKLEMSDEESELMLDEPEEPKSLVRSGSLPDILDQNNDNNNENSLAPESAEIKSHRRRSSHSFSHKLHVTFAQSGLHNGPSMVPPQAAKSEGQLTPTKNLINSDLPSGCLSDSEVDLKKSETKKVAEDDGANVTWKWGQLPEKSPPKIAAENVVSQILPDNRVAGAVLTAAEEQEKQSYFRGVLNIWRRPKPTPGQDTVSSGKKTPEEAGKYLSDLADEQMSQSQRDKYLVLGHINDSGPPHPISAIQPASQELIPETGPGLSSTVSVAGTSIELTPLSARPLQQKIVEASIPQDVRSSSAYSSMAGSPPTSDTDSDRPSDRGASSYRKTLRLTSDQICKLPLQYGSNEAEFTIVTKYQGSARCKCHIFLWRYDDKIVISDIDGTITRSDVLGHILPIIGSTWAQAGVAGLYNRIARNGYKFLYLSSRAIGQASFTRDHLRSIVQEDTNLPEGPLLLSPKSLFLAFHQEVIVKRPEEFKIACLMDIKNLFPSVRNPFFAAYGNKTTDLVAYRSVGVPPHRIFTINYQGQLKQELSRIAQSSYSQQSVVVDMLFPPLHIDSGRHELVSEHEHSDEFSNFTYWKSPLPDISSFLPAPPPPEQPKSGRKSKESVVKGKSTSPVKGDKNDK